MNSRIEELEAALAQARDEIEELRANRSILKAILDNTDLPIYMKTTDFRYTFINREYERLARVTTEVIAGKTDFDIFPEPVAALFREQDEQVLEDMSLKIFEETIPLPDGIFTFLTSKFPVCDEQGEPYAVAGVCTDITVLKKAQEELGRSESRFRSVIESCPLGVFLFASKEDGRIVLEGTNPAADAILEADTSRLVGRCIEDALSEISATEITDQIRDVARTGTKWSESRFPYGSRGRTAFVEINAFRSSPGKVATFFSDVTGRIRMEAEMHKMQKLESIGVLAGGIAHDFNNLLTAVLGNISLAELHASNPDRLRQRLDDAQKATLRAQELTQQLLTFSRGGAPVTAAISLGPVVEEAAAFALSGSSARCENRMDQELFQVEADEGQISQVIQNIVRNADQAMPRGGIVHITGTNVAVAPDSHPTLEPGDYVRIAVQDTGIGIPEDHQARVFDPYFTTKQKGSGLGLASSYSIVRNHGGTIELTSWPEQGTTFHIYLPASSSSPRDVRTVSEHPPPANKRILVMDDEETVLEVLREMLMHFDCAVDVAHDGEAAVTAYSAALGKGEPFDAVILDLTVPGGMGGIETLEKLRAMDPKVRAMVCSGYANDPAMADPARYGFKAVAAKPYDVKCLSNAFARLFS